MDNRETTTSAAVASAPASALPRVEAFIQRTESLVRPEKKIGPSPTAFQSLQAILLASC